MTRKVTGLAVAAVAMGLLTGCQVSIGATGDASASPAASNPPATAATPQGQAPSTPDAGVPQAGTPQAGAPQSGATAPESALPENAGGYIRDYDAEQRQAETLRYIQDNPPPAGPKYSLGPVMTAIYNVYGETTPANEILVARADGRFPDTGAAMTELTRSIRNEGVELTPVDPGELGGSAGCGPRDVNGQTLTTCFLVDSTTLIVLQGAAPVAEMGDALKRMHPSLSA